MHDLIIRNATVFDGSGAPGVKADIAITGDRITAVGKIGGPAKAELDATGLAAAPGFIDVHSHDDFHVLAEPDVTHNTVQGITTVIVGNCGFGAAPFEAGKEQMRAISAVGGPSTGSGRDGIRPWEGYAGYLETIDANPPSLNVAVLVGHHTVRRAAMGGVEERLPSPDELSAMKRMVAEGMEAGAAGLSTGLVYEPGRYSDTAEVVALAEEVTPHNGIYVSHMRNEGGGLLDAVAETIGIGRAAGCGVEISHHKSVGKENWGRVARSLEMIEKAQTEGIDVAADQYPYTARSTMLRALVQNGTFSAGSGGAMGRSSPSEVLLCSVPGAAEHEGRTLQSFVDEWDLTGEDAAKKLLADLSNDILVAAFGMDEGDVRMVMAHPSTMIGTDGLDTGSKPHPRAWGTYPRILGKYVREEGVISLADAVWKMTGFPAKKFALKDRGAIRANAYADIVLFDPGAVIDRATFEDPRNAPAGMPHVIVNGQFVVRDGKHTHARAGRAVRKA
jgi:N-acyl-D-amino-acid deacylase